MATIGSDLSAAKQALEAGQLVGIPTETVYGLAANALNPNAVLRIFEVKNRPTFDPLIVHTDSLDRLGLYVSNIPELARRLAEQFWPGPLTLLLPKRDCIPDLVTSGLATVAVRIPHHPLTLKLLQSLDFPLAAPSANPFGYISPTTARHVADQLGFQVPYILDGGPARIGVESTIVGFDTETPTLYRLGGISVEAIEAVIGPVYVQPHSTSQPQAPGMLSSHYAPRKPLTLLTSTETLPTNPNIGLLAFQHLSPGIPTENQRILSPSGDVAEAAKNLFAFLRELDALPLDRIYAETVPNTGLGRAINDRLRRAAA